MACEYFCLSSLRLSCMHIKLLLYVYYVHMDVTDYFAQRRVQSIVITDQHVFTHITSQKLHIKITQNSLCYMW